MGLYADRIFPFFVDKELNSPELGEHRADVLRDVAGDTLEIGFGSGANLPYFPANVTRLAAIEPAGGMTRHAAERIAAWPGTVTLQQLAGEQLPYEDAQFDSVVITLTLCSVKDPAAVLSEMRRVLRPGGTVHFLEHVAASAPKTRAWQDRLNRVSQVVGCGCNLNRDTANTFLRGGFTFQRLDHARMPGPRLLAALHPTIRGVAVAPA